MNSAMLKMSSQLKAQTRKSRRPTVVLDAWEQQSLLLTWDCPSMPRWQRLCDSSSRFAVFLVTSFGGRWQPERLICRDRPLCVCVCMGKLCTRWMSTFAGSLRAANHWRAAAQSKDLAWRQRLTTSLVHTISTKTSCAALGWQNLVGCAVAHAFLTVASVLLTGLNTHPVLACLLALHVLLMPFDQLNPLDRSPYLENCAPHHIKTPHNTPHPIHTARSYFNVSFLACPHPHSPSTPNHTCLFAYVLLGVWFLPWSPPRTFPVYVPVSMSLCRVCMFSSLPVVLPVLRVLRVLCSVLYSSPPFYLLYAWTWSYECPPFLCTCVLF